MTCFQSVQIPRDSYNKHLTKIIFLVCSVRCGTVFYPLQFMAQIEVEKMQSIPYSNKVSNKVFYTNCLKKNLSSTYMSSLLIFFTVFLSVKLSTIQMVTLITFAFAHTNSDY